MGVSVVDHGPYTDYEGILNPLLGIQLRPPLHRARGSLPPTLATSLEHKHIDVCVLIELAVRRNMTYVKHVF
jgi:hypothetical protein